MFVDWVVHMYVVNCEQYIHTIPPILPQPPVSSQVPYNVFPDHSHVVYDVYWSLGPAVYTSRPPNPAVKTYVHTHKRTYCSDIVCDCLSHIHTYYTPPFTLGVLVLAAIVAGPHTVRTHFLDERTGAISDVARLNPHQPASWGIT